MLRFLVVLTLFLLAVNEVAAQGVSLPEFSISNELVEDGKTIEKFQLGDSELKEIKDKVFSDILRLQYQKYILSRLIERQSSIAVAAKQYAEMGVDFYQPPVSKGLCEQLPENLLCLGFYPGQKTYENIIRSGLEKTIDEKQSELFDRLWSQDALNENIRNSGAMDQNVSFQGGLAEKYAWTDIRCLNGKCDALIIDVAGEGNLARLSAGDIFPQDSSLKIASITQNEVYLLSKDKKIRIKASTAMNSRGDSQGAVSDEKQAELLRLLKENQDRLDTAKDNQNFEAMSKDDSDLFLGESNSKAIELGETGLF